MSFNISGKVWLDAVYLNFWIFKMDFMNFDMNNELSFTTEGSLGFSTSKDIDSIGSIDFTYTSYGSGCTYPYKF